MKQTIPFLLLLCACTPSKQKPGTSLNVRTEPTNLISVTEANTMIESYVTSVQNCDTCLKSWIIDASGFRQLLQDTSVTSLKIMLAHNPDYLSKEGSGNNVGYASSALTIVAAGVNRSGNIVLPAEGLAIDVARPCPPSCPQGNAANALLPQ